MIALKKLIAQFTFVFLTSFLFSQNLTVNDLETLANKSDWASINAVLINKGWVFYDSKAETDLDYGLIQWSFKKENYSDEAQAWLAVTLRDDKPILIKMEFYNFDHYNSLVNSIGSRGYTVMKSDVANSSSAIKYKNNLFFLIFETYKRTNSSYSYSDASLNSYFISVYKKGSEMDSDNGFKTVYWSDGKTPQFEYNLIDGVLNGSYKSYSIDGKLNLECQYKNGKMNGKAKVYNENGDLGYECFMKDDSIHGNFVSYSNFGKYEESIYVNGKRNGQGKFTHYDMFGNVYCLESGLFENDNRVGKWDCYYPNILGNPYSGFLNYKDGSLHGEINDFLSIDTLTKAVYYEGMLNGPYSREIITKFNYHLGNIPDLITKEALLQDCSGEYYNNVKIGYWKYFSNGVLVSEGYYNNGLKSGNWKYYVPTNKKILEICYGSGWKNEDDLYGGELMLELEYMNGVENGKSIRYYYHELMYDDNGVSLNTFQTTPAHVVSNYKNGKLDGYYSIEVSQDSLIRKGQYKEGLKTGVWVEEGIDDDGEKYYLKINYSNDKQNGLFQLKNDKGIIVIEGTMRNDVPVSDWTYFDPVTGLKLYVINKDDFGKNNYQTYFFTSGNQSAYLKFNGEDYNNIILFYDTIPKSIKSEFKLISNSNGLIKFSATFYAVDSVETFNYYLNSNQVQGFLAATQYDGKKLDGPYKLVVNNKVVTEGQYKNNAKSGNWSYYHHDKNLVVKSDYENDKRLNEKFYDIKANVPFSGEVSLPLNNGIVEVIKIKDGLRHGVTKAIGPDGAVISKSHYKSGVVTK